MGHQYPITPIGAKYIRCFRQRCHALLLVEDATDAGFPSGEGRYEVRCYCGVSTYFDKAEEVQALERDKATNAELASILRLLAEGVKTNITGLALLEAAERLEKGTTNE